jgi:hypothetical protein
MTLDLDPRFQSLDNAKALHVANYPGVYFLCKGTTVVYVGWLQRLRPKLNHLTGGNRVGAGRRKLGKTTFAIRLRPSTKEILDKAASQANTTSSDYAEQAILTKARKDGIE